MLFNDTYQTIAKPSQGLYKEKGSKFLSYAFPINNDFTAKKHLEASHQLHPKAVHHCYAYRLGIDRMNYRMSDDGEPSGTAGRPILNTLYSREVTNVLIVVVRYFGGTLLGVPGLIHAYKTAAEAAMNEAEVTSKYLVHRYELRFSYIRMNDVMRVVKEMELPVVEQEFGMECIMVVEVRATLTERFLLRCEKVDGLTMANLK